MVALGTADAPQYVWLAACEVAGLTWRRSRPGQFYGQCPAHDDGKGSAAMGVRDDGSVVMSCKAGCPQAAMLAAVGLTPRDMQPRSGQTVERLTREASEREARCFRNSLELLTKDPRLDNLIRTEGWTTAAIDALLVGSYSRDRVAMPERDHRGRAVAVFVYRPRLWRTPGTVGHKSCEEGGTRGLTYRAGGPRGSSVVLVEGGPCAVSAMSLGHEAVAFPFAAFDVPATWWPPLLRDRDVTILPDADEQGRDAAERHARALRTVTSRVSIGELFAGHEDGSDVADLLREEGTEQAALRVRRAIENAAVITRPKRGRPPTQRQKSETYLREVLADHCWHPSKVIEEGRPGSLDSYMDARRAIGVKSRQRRVGVTNRWEVQLPRPRPTRSDSGSYIRHRERVR